MSEEFIVRGKLTSINDFNNLVKLMAQRSFLNLNSETNTVRINIKDDN